MDAFAPPALMMRNAAEVIIEPVTWLWPGRIAVGKLAMIGGEPGTGKSQVAIAIAAAVTTGARWPCCDDAAPVGGVIILATEDDLADTIAPRLIAAGADLACVRTVTAVHDPDAPGRRRALDLAADLARLEDALDLRPDVRLIVIDPITSYMGRVDSHRTTDVRSVLEPLAEMAARRRVAILAITHHIGGTDHGEGKDCC
jgi:putative DNA primase/helicase